MIARNLLAAACSIVAISAFAVDASKVDKTIELKDGSTLYVFKDGKMGMEKKSGGTARMKAGHVMEAKDGQKYMMVGDEVARLDWLLKKDQKAQ